MKRYNQSIDLIIEYKSDPQMKTLPDTETDLKAAGIPVVQSEPLFKTANEAKDLPVNLLWQQRLPLKPQLMTWRYIRGAGK